ncbi:unnamed protein product [Triticum turgidum subsp. durum]|uniref:4-hydroxyphenylacetaldehyde oxime monooxygenase n=1 Tax=Triticum turgidum subsp. durum TaxID=4567 RepID=A0A9R0SV62_TRITD|nr:unnamed protein product [Triticum turgidum subsp. durum]
MVLEWQLVPTTTLLATLVLPLLSILLLVAAARARRTGENTHHRLPPRPPGLPILGNLHQMGALPHQSLRELARRHGPVMMLRLGTVPTVVVSSADAARDVLKTHDADCCSRPDTPGPRRLSYQHNDVAFSPYSEQWRARRKLLVVEFLSKRRIQATWYAREAEMGKLVTGLATASVNGREPVSLEDHVFGYMDGIVGTVAFGNQYGTEHFAHKEHFHHVIDEAMVVRSSFSAEDYFPNALGRLVDRLTGVASLRERVFKEFDAFFEMMLDQAKHDNGCVGLIDVLIGLMKEEHQGSFKVSRDVVKGLLTNTFIGAVDTGAVTIIWAMAELVRNPHVLNKVQDEIRTLVGDKEKLQQEDVTKLKYLKMVVMETLRLHPALPLLVPRETMRHITVSGYDVPVKTRILVNAWAIGRDPANWDNPEEFIPERFEGEEDVNFNRAQFEFLPFGAGRRMCPGIDMGLATTEFTLANLLYYFDWEFPEGLRSEDMSMEEAGGLTIHKKTPLLLVPTRYQA